MNYSCLIFLLFVHCAHSLSFQFVATQPPNSHYGDNIISATCDPTRKCAVDTSSRSACERWGCCFQKNECFSKKYFIINQGPSEPPKKKVPVFSVPRNDDGLVVKATRADALKYCQDNYPNGGLPVVTATADWLTLAGIREKFEGLFTGAAFVGIDFDLYLDYNHLTDDVNTVEGEFVCKGADFEYKYFEYDPASIVTMWAADLEVTNSVDIERGILCQHDAT